jgi:hypothetical protein
MPPMLHTHISLIYHKRYIVLNVTASLNKVPLSSNLFIIESHPQGLLKVKFQISFSPPNLKLLQKIAIFVLQTLALKSSLSKFAAVNVLLLFLVENQITERLSGPWYHAFHNKNVDMKISQALTSQ